MGVDGECVSRDAHSTPQVPPYARAGLYKQLATLKDLVREFREDAKKNASLRPVIAANMQQAGLYEDLPYTGRGGDGGVLTAEAAEELPADGEVVYFVSRPGGCFDNSSEKFVLEYGRLNAVG